MIHLLYNKYTTTDPLRQNELDYCYNSNHKFFKSIIEYTDRLTFKEVIDLAWKETDEDDIVVISNSDIKFNQSVINLNDIALNEFYAITRYELNQEIHHNIWGSQDTWVFKLNLDTYHKIKKMNLNFHFGVPGCDNRLAWEFYNQGFTVKNPYDKIVTMHVHSSQQRNYAPPVPPPYLIVNKDAVRVV